MRAMLWDALPEGEAQCHVCSHACHIPEGGSGRCGVRVNHKGELRSLVGNVSTSLQMDPVEKKPLYHFLPGTRTFSVGSAGCNFSCRFCQNHQISQINPKSRIAGRRVMPEELVRLAVRNRAPSMAFTYNEPTVFFEQAYEAAGMAKARNIKVILVSNGFMSRDFLQAMRQRVDAVNIDLKSFSDTFYHRLCGGRLQPVLDNLKTIREMGWWLEVTTLLIPGLNDSPAELREMAGFIRDELGPETPWHISGFHGAHLMADHPSTPPFQLEESWKSAREEGLAHVYVGNIQSPIGSNTYCPSCGALLVERIGYRARSRIRDGICRACQTPVAGVWK